MWRHHFITLLSLDVHRNKGAANYNLFPLSIAKEYLELVVMNNGTTEVPIPTTDDSDINDVISESSC